MILRSKGDQQLQGSWEGQKSEVYEDQKKTAGESLKDFSHSSLFLKKLILTCHNGMFSYFPNFYA